MELLLVEEATLFSKFYTLELVAFIVCIAIYTVVRITRAHSAISTLKVMVTLFFVLSWAGYKSYTGNWHKIGVTEQTFTLYFPINTPAYTSIDDIQTIRPRYGKNGCSIIIRTDNETFKSAEFDAERCNEISAQLNSTLVNAPSLH